MSETINKPTDTGVADCTLFIQQPLTSKYSGNV